MRLGKGIVHSLRVIALLLPLVSYANPKRPAVQMTASAAADSRGPLRPGHATLPVLWLTLLGCGPSPLEGACGGIPDLAVELDGEVERPSTYVIRVRLDGRHVECPAPRCIVALEETTPDGVGVEFWAESPNDRRKVVFTARVRVLSAAEPGEVNPVPWYVQVMSSQWIGEPVDACAVAWDTFPPYGQPAGWLATPDEESDLATSVMYHYLAAELITAGAVDPGPCPDGGLLEGGVPSACGAEGAQTHVDAWQDQFDAILLDSARRSRIPAWLVKGVIAEESQFWPGSVSSRGEYGLGHLTEAGADNSLLWNKELYQELCPSVLGDSYCGLGFSHQSDYRRALLRGALLARVDADCHECDWGIDLVSAQDGVPVLAQTLLAYCSQTGRMVSNVTHETPGRHNTYEDMWRLTLASYAVGPGCLAEAMKSAWRSGGDLSWASVSAELSEACTGAVNYVEHIERQAAGPDLEGN